MFELFILPLDADAFASFRQSFAELLLALFGLVCMITLAVTIIYVVQGEKDSAKKVLRWLIVSAIGFLLISVIKAL